MDLLSPCRSCLKCLPFFHVSPPSSPRHATAAPSAPSSHSDGAFKGTDPSHRSEKPPCPDVTHAQGVSSSSVEEEQKVSPQYASGHKEGIAGKVHGDLGDAVTGEEKLLHDEFFPQNNTAKQVNSHYDEVNQAEDAMPVSSVETSSSLPELYTEGKDNGRNSTESFGSVEPVLVDSYHSEPVEVFDDLQDDDEVLSQHSASSHGTPRRRRRRDQLRDQIKGIKHQIKQGGLHIREEGTKHMQTVMENMNKQAQRIEGSGSFSVFPRASKN